MALLRKRKQTPVEPDTLATEPEKNKSVSAKQASHAFVVESQRFERSRIGDIERREKYWQYISLGACAIAGTCAIAVASLAPLKEKVPYVVRVDNNTGATDIVNILDKSTIKKMEQVDRYFSANYVQLVESYDWYTLQAQVNKAMMFSDANMQKQLQNRYSLPTAPHKTLKDAQRITVKINNTTILDEAGIIQVRFTTTQEPVSGTGWNPQTQSLYPKPIVKNHIATIGYEYVNIPTVDDVRLVNPLGFTVKTYRVDDDATTPVPQAPVTVTAVVPPTTNAVTNAVAVPPAQTVTTQTTQTKTVVASTGGVQ